MKTIICILILLLPAYWLAGQGSSLPAVDLRTLDGELISAKQIVHNDEITLVVFWNSTNGKCCESLQNLNDAWMEELREKGIRLVAISVDCNGSWSQVKPMVQGQGWEFDAYIDVNGDLMRAMNVSEVPCTLLFDQARQLLCRYHCEYAGSQELISENIMNHITPPARDLILRTQR